MFKIKWYLSCMLWMLIMGVGVFSSKAQNASDKEIHAVAREDGRAYVYHAEIIPLSHGFNVYRSDNGKDWNKLTDKPFYPAGDGYQFKKMVGDIYTEIQKMAETDDTQALFLRLRNSDKGLLTSFTVPEVANALGRLYIDEDAPIGQTVYYRFEIVDDLGQPTGEQIQGQTSLTPLVFPAPSGLEATNKAKQITLSWNYVPNGTPAAENVIRFQIFYHKKGSKELTKGNEKFLARTIRNTDYRYSFDVPETGQDYVFTVHAVDFTGQMSKPSDSKTIRVRENIPPSIISGVKARAVSQYAGQITWPVSTELDLAGYHIYRARSDDEQYTRITKTMLAPLETAYLDSLLEPDTQYRYKVTAVDTSGNEGPKSNPAHVFIADNRVPNPVPALTVHYDKKATKMDWDTVRVPGGLRTYMLLRRRIHTKSENSFTQINNEQLRESTFMDSGVGGGSFVEGATYQYGISVISENGHASDTVYAEVKIPDVTPPAPPGFIQAKMQEGRRVGLTWNASPSTDVVKYRLYRGSQSSSDSMLTEVLRGQRYFRDENVPFGNTYLYTVSAVDSLGNESTTMPVDTLVSHRMNPPAPVRNVQALKTEEGVDLAWESTTDDQITGYHIYKSEIPTGVYKSAGKVKKNVFRWSDTNGNSENWYKVFTVDATGREAPTAEATRVKVKN